MRAKIGVSDRMMKFDFFFGVMLGQTVLYHSDNLSRTFICRKETFQKVKTLPK